MIVYSECFMYERTKSLCQNDVITLNRVDFLGQNSIRATGLAY